MLAPFFQQCIYREHHDGIREEERETQTTFDHHGKVNARTRRKIQGDDILGLGSIRQITAHAECYIQRSHPDDGPNEAAAKRVTHLLTHGLLQGQDHPGSFKAINGHREEEGKPLDGELFSMFVTRQMEVLKVEPEHNRKGEQIRDLGEHAKDRQIAQIRHQRQQEQRRENNEQPLGLGQTIDKRGQVLGNKDQVRATKPHLRDQQGRIHGYPTGSSQGGKGHIRIGNRFPNHGSIGRRVLFQGLKLDILFPIGITRFFPHGCRLSRRNRGHAISQRSQNDRRLLDLGSTIHEQEHGRDTQIANRGHNQTAFHQTGLLEGIRQA